MREYSFEGADDESAWDAWSEMEFAENSCGYADDFTPSGGLSIADVVRRLKQLDVPVEAIEVVVRVLDECQPCCLGETMQSLENAAHACATESGRITIADLAANLQMELNDDEGFTSPRILLALTAELWEIVAVNSKTAQHRCPKTEPPIKPIAPLPVQPDGGPNIGTNQVQPASEAWQMPLAIWREVRDYLRRACEDGNDPESEARLRVIGGMTTDAAHRVRVERAIQEGKPVPPEVRADYPAL